MLVKVAELIGPALDWAVAKCEDKNGILHDDGITRCIVIAAPSGVYKGRYTPTVNWAQGGPIIEREKIGTDFLVHRFRGPVWYVRIGGGDCMYGPTPLIAAMRCLVASKLGTEIEIPNSLFKG